MKLFLKIFEQLSPFLQMERNILEGNTPFLSVGLSAVHKAHFLAALFLRQQEPFLVITKDEGSATRLMEEINRIAGEQAAILFPYRDISYRSSEVASREYEQRRLGVLSRIAAGEAPIVVTSIRAVMTPTIPKEVLEENTFALSVGDTIPMEHLLQRLTAAGYVRRPQIDGASQFSLRGGIVDLFPPQEERPVRIEYWGDEIDSIAYFDLETQRRSDSLDKISVSPANEVILPLPVLSEKLEALERSVSRRKNADEIRVFLQKEREKIQAGIPFETLDPYFPLAYGKITTLLSYFPGNVPLFLSETGEIKEAAKEFFSQYREDIKLLFEENVLFPGLDQYAVEYETLEGEFSRFRLAYLETFMRGNLGRLKEIITFSPLQNPCWSGDLSLLDSDLKPLLEEGYFVAILTGSARAAHGLERDLADRGYPVRAQKDVETDLLKGQVFLLEGALSAGMTYPEAKIAVISTGRSVAPISRRRPKKKKGEEIRSLSDLSVGDYVVHVSHGIGVFDGIHKLDLHGVIKDYIKIRYAGADTLYVPVTQLDMVSRYIGPKEDSKVKLNRLNSGEWQKTRSRVKKAVAEMAEELIALYAKRLKTPGIAFDKDTDYQKDFEAYFPYEETEDQLRCVEEIKEDMEKPNPMDRLLCGDVGFGKTEVALRAAFKCVCSGYQCAILCPTTILAWQHYQTLLNRMGSFPVEIELLSRFRTAKEQKAVVDKLRRGVVDIVVGTHRVVSKDVQFKKLGLAIIDEEQRFGVTHKERFKEMFAGVDVLTLSATPIPRTLNMAMSGIRDMSVIEEAPLNRQPVQTYVMEHENGVIYEALRRELRRGGQCYYIHNNIESIFARAARIKEALPEARVEVAHGRMGEDDLSRVWQKLMEQEIDILVCTTIIETGVDVSNVNTLVIENADRFGLSQLYQLRGRVGRSARRAFAYFTFQPGKSLSEIAAKRLDAIRQFTKFGSGFQIALRDLEIRGAGNILGTRQHGHMEAVGYDMYLRLLNEAVAEKQGQTVNARPLECLVDIRLEAHIPETYIEDQAQRIDVYRKIASVQKKEDALDVVDELIDRFGDPPKSVQGLIDVALLRNTAAAFGYREITQKSDALWFIPEQIDLNQSVELCNRLKGRASINASAPPAVTVRLKGQKPLDVMREVLELLVQIREENDGREKADR